MATLNSFEELIVWQKARRLSKEIYQRTQIGSFARDFDLKNQINRSSGSIPDNIAEGLERNGNNEFAYFLTIAKGSAGEVRSQLFRAIDRQHITQAEFEAFDKLALEITRMLGSLRSRINQSKIKGSRFIGTRPPSEKSSLK